ncbi:hypothetical protein TIFTF001_022357 [Ficus carica]|uniref:Leucine-rich repeat-containing N-terminal plant-type domain-containing protein n=1 Tax=Ficus carica TaxID=3494 RepID=A0AA88AEE4_FICCA|nr:hypothetical protein TIFTF001_022357 [Ficus carica]
MARKISLLNICITVCLVSYSFYVSHTFNISIITSSNLIIRCVPDQSSILLQLKHEFSPEGPAKSSPKMRTWKEGSDCCFWDGVICDETSSGLVVGLNLSDSSLQGPLRSNSSLFGLVRLQKLDLAFNDFSSSRIPSRLGQLSSLTYLNLCGSNISGAVPSSIWNLSQLTLLDLSFNDLYGRIPSTLGNLRQLNVLDLSGCGFSGEVPFSIGNLTSLKRLLLLGNSFTGQVFSSLGQLKYLTSLDVSYNNFSGEIPSWLFTLPSLISMSLDNNAFSGPLNIYNGSSPQLKFMSLSGNNLSGQIPKSLAELKSLIFLDLHSNDLSGTLELGNFSELWYLDLSENSLLSRVKASTSSKYIPQLQFLYLSSCNLTEFPYLLKYQYRIEQLNLSHNSIRGHIPNWFGRIGKEKLSYTERDSLKLLDLSHNKLSGEVPNIMGDLRSLVALDLGINSFTGLIPLSFGNLTDLQSLDLSNNNFSGEIPQQLTNLKFLDDLNLSHNQLTGPIPQGGKLGTFPGSSFEGNPGLCGSPLPKKCYGFVLS